MKLLHPQHTEDTINEQLWYSYCIQIDPKKPLSKSEITEWFVGRKKANFLIYSHFYDLSHETAVSFTEPLNLAVAVP